MLFVGYPYRNAEIILDHDPITSSDWNEVKEIIAGIYEFDIIRAFKAKVKKGKSLSVVLNDIFEERFKAKGWTTQAPIFQVSHLRKGSTFRLDYAKPKSISVEVAFNHGGSAAWNLIKPTLASNMNLMKRDTETNVGLIICATNAFRAPGGFDNTIGTYEKYISYLDPMNFQLISPIMIVGLLPPRTFEIEQYKKKGSNRWTGRIKYLVPFLRKPDNSFRVRTSGGTYKGRIYVFNMIEPRKF